jgi:hypothetical protein
MSSGYKLKVVTGASIALLLAACAGMPGLLYVEPTQGDRARVRFTTNLSATTVLYGFEESECRGKREEWMRLSNYDVISPTPRRLGIPLWNHHPNAAKEVFVNAARPVNLMFSATLNDGYYVNQCLVPLTFKFEKDRDYEVAFSLTPQNCIATANEITSVAGNPVRTSLKTFGSISIREPSTCLEQRRSAGF